MPERPMGQPIPLRVRSRQPRPPAAALPAQARAGGAAEGGERVWHRAEMHLLTTVEPPLALDVRRSRVYRLAPVELAILQRPFPLTWAALVAALEADHGRATLAAAVERLQERQLLYLGVEPLPAPLPRGPLTRLELGVAEDCNLRCPYCFVSQGSFGGPRRLMPLEVARRAVALLFAEAGDAPFVQVGFYGGEPLLNIPVVRAVIDEASALAAERGKQILFDLITNGTRLDEELCAFLRAHGVAIQLSLDGPPAINDALRPRLGGQGSYRAATASLRWLAGYPRVQGRATLTRANPQVDEIMEHLLALGLPAAVARPVVGAEGGLGLDAAASERIVHGYRRLAEAVLAAESDDAAARRAIPFVGYFVKLLEGMPRRVPCQQGAWAVACAADGRLYPCKDMAARPDYVIGTVWTGIDWARAYDSQQGLLLCQQRAPKKAECARCWGRELCQISCMHVCLEPKGEATGTAVVSGWECAVQLGVIEVALELFDALRERRPAVFWQLLQQATAGELAPPPALVSAAAG
ncbi:MAG TPA: radical SAM protein [Chloroflexota bacterium]|jgi:uncharacterized protein|nr:radical SAM protein [Chloroflexota bacterium]